MDGIRPASFATFDDDAQWSSLGAALPARCLSREDVAKLLGRNFRRLFAEAAAT